MAKRKHIALVCPGGRIEKSLADKVDQIAADFEDALALTFHPQCFLEAGHFAGPDEMREEAFVEVANNPAIDAVWFARGGYGACRFSDRAFTALSDAAREKTYLGYSDAGFLLGRLYREGIGRPVHGPMPADFAWDNGEAAVRRALAWFAYGAHECLEPAAASGEKTLSFNITVLAHLVGTPWTPDFSDHVLMLEDVGEYLYRIDRAMFAITSDESVRRAKGIRLGRVSAVPENDRPFGQNAKEIITDWCERAGIAYLGPSDIGHDADNKVAPFGLAAPSA
ncbi:MAG: LD-carboxypeptidase [Pseudomonadota bacterium]